MHVSIPRIIDHRNIGPLLDALLDEPEFKIGTHSRPDPDAWYRRPVWLEVPTGELADDGLKTMAIVGRANPEPARIDGSERFGAQGLEGKVRIRKDLFGALMNMRDLIAPNRGRIVVE